MLGSRSLFGVLALAVGLTILGLAGSATAQTSWFGMTNSNWNNPANWSAGVPTSALDAHINFSPNNPSLNADGAAKNLYLGKTSAGHLTVPGNTLTVSAAVYLGEATGTTSTITQSGGIVNVAGYLWAGSTGGDGADPTKTGSGNYTMTGGTLNVGNIDAGQLGTSVFHQSGGEVNVGFAAIGENYYRFVNGIPATPGQAAYLLEGDGVVNSGPFYVGLWGGYATLTVQGSAVMNASLLGVDSYASWCPLGATGEINLHGNGQIVVSDYLELSGNSVANGTLNQDGGTLTATTLRRGAGTGTYNFTGGTLNVSSVQGMDLDNGGGTVNVGGGGTATNLEMGFVVTTNIALGKTATQSSAPFTLPPQNAVDGVFTTYAHTNYDDYAWWQVDLTGGGTTSVHDVVLTARSDGYTWMLSNFYLRVLGDDGVTVLWQDKFITDVSEILDAGEKFWIQLPTAVDGRYVQVQLDYHNLDPEAWGGGYLCLTECVVGAVDRYGYSQVATATLGIELDPTGETCDKLIAGDLTLAGTLDVTSLGGDFASGQVFDILDWDTLSGTFDTVNLPALSGGLSWDTSRLYTTGELTVVPEPSTIALLILGTLSLAGVARRR